MFISSVQTRIVDKIVVFPNRTRTRDKFTEGLLRRRCDCVGEVEIIMDGHFCNPFTYKITHEQLSKAFIYALGSTCRLSIEFFVNDGDGVDGSITGDGFQGLYPDPQILFQVKASYDIKRDHNGINYYYLDHDAYSQLKTGKKRGHPFIFILIHIPRDIDKRLIINNNNHWKMKHKAYWFCFKGESELCKSIKLDLRDENILNHSTLMGILENVSKFKDVSI